MPSVPVTAKPLRRAAATPLRSSINTSSAPSVAAQSEGRSFSGVERFVFRIVGFRNAHHFEPCRGTAYPFAHREGSLVMCKLVADDGGNRNMLKQPGKNIALSNQHQIVQRPGIGDNEPHVPLKADAAQVAPLLFQILKRIFHEYFMSLQETVERLARFKAEHAAQLGFGDMTVAEFLQRQRLQRPPRDFPLACADAPRHVVGNMHSQIHAVTLRGSRPQVNTTT